MPEPLSTTIVTNTTPLIAISAATGNLDVLRLLFQRVIVPLEVAEEIAAGGREGMGIKALAEADWLERRTTAVTPNAYLRNTLDRGEAAVIQTAMDENVPLVCIDEAVGRRIARLSGLTLTGSIGVLLKAKQRGYPLSMPEAVERMQAHGIWLSETVVRFALAQQ